METGFAYALLDAYRPWTVSQKGRAKNTLIAGTDTIVPDYE